MIQNEMKWSDRKDTNGTKVNVKVNTKNLLYCLVRRIFTKGMLGILPQVNVLGNKCFNCSHFVFLVRIVNVKFTIDVTNLVVTVNLP